VETIAFPPESYVERLIVGIASDHSRAFATFQMRKIHVPISFGRAPFGDELLDYRERHLR